jgi:hypothetical protein
LKYHAAQAVLKGCLRIRETERLAWGISMPERCGIFLKSDMFRKNTEAEVRDYE